MRTDKFVNGNTDDSYYYIQYNKIVCRPAPPQKGDPYHYSSCILLASIVHYCRDAYGNIVRTIRILSLARKLIVLQRENGSKRWNVEKDWVSLTQYLAHKVAYPCIIILDVILVQ